MHSDSKLFYFWLQISIPRHSDIQKGIALHFNISLEELVDQFLAYWLRLFLQKTVSA